MILQDYFNAFHRGFSNPSNPLSWEILCTSKQGFAAVKITRKEWIEAVTLVDKERLILAKLDLAHEAAKERAFFS